ncbi:hypothetical protein [Stenotrophomonas sp.]|uniref:hypothetical protein n=1 Tax=Stenotrophomonas sp. TaxID=69392 RepID=UPI0028A07E6F|nr:hypothetical protein [Stenotrophomonas sp.]
MKKNLNGTLLCVSLITWAVTSQLAWAAARDGETWAGEYSQASTLCTEPDSGRSCANAFSDHLSIIEDSTGYKVELHSTQAMQHVCSFVLRMKPEAGKLIHDSASGRVAIERRAGVLRVSSGGVDPTAAGLGVCGAHADIDGLTFSSSGKGG